MSRFRVTIDVDTTDAEVTYDDVDAAALAGIDTMIAWLHGAWVDLEVIEELGT